MSEQTKPDDKSSHVTSSIAIIAILLSIFVVQDTIFKPTRPPMINTERAFSEDARSRLWQDPFQAVEEYRKRYQVQENQQHLFIELDKKTENKAILFAETRKKENVLIQMPTPDKNYAYEYGRDLIRVCAEKIDGGKPYPDSQSIANSFEELHCDILKETEKIDPKIIHVLAVMVPGGPYAEDKERRLRSRYAVISALAETDYVAKDPEHIQFLDFDKTCKALLQEIRSNIINGGKNSDKKDIRICELRDIMPYEWFQPNLKTEEKRDRDPNKKPEVLVLWLDNDAFMRSKHPLNLLGYLIHKIKEVQKPKTEELKLSFSIIGPHGSELLYKMSHEVTENRDTVSDKDAKYYDSLNNDESTKMYTATATIERKEICHPYCEKNEKESGESSAKRFLENAVIRTVSMQEAIVKTLVCELALRGINPLMHNTEIQIEDSCKPGVLDEVVEFKKVFYPNYPKTNYHHIVFIGEKDNFFSQKLTQTFRALLSQKKDHSNVSVFGGDTLHFFNYLRGLDGITSEQASSSQEAKNKIKESQENKLIDIKEQLAKPVGPSQLDYLLSLAAQIEKLDKEISSKGEGEIKAIGITGSDTYDKLLILQAMKSKFPGILFFTTDLDSRLLHPSEIKWTRNLIVASSFGLTLARVVESKEKEREKIQDDTPPFRDNFQTSLFLSTRLALCQSDKEFSGCSILTKEGKKNNEASWIDYPRLFEIGNSGAIDISHDMHEIMPLPEIKNLNFVTRPDQELLTAIEDNASYYFPLVVFILLLIFIFSAIFVPRSYQFGINLVTFILVTVVFGYLCLLLVISNNLGSEPVSFTNGVSSWPSNGIKLMAIFLSGYFIWCINKQLNSSWKETRKRFLLNEVNVTQKIK